LLGECRRLSSYSQCWWSCAGTELWSQTKPWTGD